VHRSLCFAATVMTAATMTMALQPADASPAAQNLGSPLAATTVITSPLAKPPVVPTGALLGAHVDYDHSKNIDQSTEINLLEENIGRTLDIDNSYYGFDDDLVGAQAVADRAAGRIPLDSWGCFDPGAIVSGDLDTAILAQAEEVKEFGTPIYIRWGWEMDQGANHVCANQLGPTEFVLAWRHLWNLFQQAGATNAAWVWSPSAAGFSNGTAMEYYPGDAYVDYASADGYSRSTTDPTDFAHIFGPLYQAFSTRKPILIGETGAVVGPTQAPWITQTGNEIDGLGTQLGQAFPDVKALVFFDSRGCHDYTITTADSVTAFAQLARSAYFNPLGKPLGPENPVPMIDQ
jgi:hypothetical protein